MSETMWLMLTAVASGAFGRIVKFWPGLPKGLLPWLVLAAGYGISFAMAWNGDGSISDEATAAWAGLAAGLVAVGGHEALKPALAKFLGPELASKLLGKLPAPPKKP